MHIAQTQENEKWQLAQVQFDQIKQRNVSETAMKQLRDQLQHMEAQLAAQRETIQAAQHENR